MVMRGRRFAAVIMIAAIVRTVIMPAGRLFAAHQPVEHPHHHDAEAAAEGQCFEPPGHVWRVRILSVNAPAGDEITHHTSHHDQHHGLKCDEKPPGPLGVLPIIRVVVRAVFIMHMIVPATLLSDLFVRVVLPFGRVIVVFMTAASVVLMIMLLCFRCLIVMIVPAAVVTFVLVIVLMAHGLTGVGISKTVPAAKLAA